MSSVGEVPTCRDAFEREGYVLRPGLFREAVVLLQALLDTGQEAIRAREDITFDCEGRGATNLGYLGHGDDLIAEFVCAKTLVELAAGMLGEDVYLLKARLNIKWPKDAPELRGGWDPHQDRAAWAKEGLPGKAAVTVAIAIDPCDAVNGALEVLPGSHAHGIIEHTRIGEGYGISGERFERLAAEHGRLRVDMAPGDAFFFSGDLIHFSAPNHSAKRRALLFITYNAVSNSPAEGVGPSRYRYTQPLHVRPAAALRRLLAAYHEGTYTPTLDYATIARVREVDVAEELDSGWTDLTPTLFEK